MASGLVFLCVYSRCVLGGVAGLVFFSPSHFWIKNLPLWFFKLAIAGVIVLLICAPSVMLYAVFNPKYRLFAKYACYALIAFTLLASLLYHMPTDPSQRINFMKNMSIIGGFLALSMCF